MSYLASCLLSAYENMDGLDALHAGHGHEVPCSFVVCLVCFLSQKGAQRALGDRVLVRTVKRVPL